MSSFSSQAGLGGIQPVSAAASAAAAHATRPDRDRQQRQQQKPPQPKQAESDNVTTSPEALAALIAADPDAKGQKHGQPFGHSHQGASTDHAEAGSHKPVPVDLPHLDIQG